MRRFFSMYKVAVRSAFSTVSAYRANFMFSFFMVLLGNLGVPLVTVLIYGAGASLPGYTMYEALLFQSAFMLVTGICSPLFYSMVWTTMSHVKEGSFDLLLLKPCPVAVTTAAYSFELEGLGALVGGLLIFILSAVQVQSAGIWQWVSFFYFILCALMFVFGMVLIMSATTFKWVGNSRIFEMFTSVTGFGRYPLSIFPRSLSIVLTSIFPVAIMGCLPAYALLGEITAAYYLVIIPCALFMLLGIYVFRAMVSAYQSAGG